MLKTMLKERNYDLYSCLFKKKKKSSIKAKQVFQPINQDIQTKNKKLSKKDK